MNMLCRDGKSRILDEVTTDKLNQLDHILIEEKIVKNSYVTEFKNLISDHKTITIRIPDIGNLFSEEFKELKNFDEEHHLKPKRHNIQMNDPFENPEDSRLNLTEAEKSSLNSRNWIQGELIDKYFNILRIKTNDCLLFALDFYNGIKEEKI